MRKGTLRNFPDLEMQEPTTEKTHMSDISYKVYMGKTIICHTHAMSTIIILHSCMVTRFTCTGCTCTGVSKNLQSFTVSVHKECNLV